MLRYRGAGFLKVSKISIRVDPQTGQTYFPKVIRLAGFIGRIEGLPNALTFTLIKPGSTLADVESSLKIILQDIALRRKQEASTLPEKEQTEPAKLRTRPKKIATTGVHPLFIKYSRAWLSTVTGYSKGYLSRLATGKVPLGPFFIERVCSVLGEPESELFLHDAATDS